MRGKGKGQRKAEIYEAEEVLLGTVWAEVVGMGEVWTLWDEVRASPWWAWGDVDVVQSRSDAVMSSYETVAGVIRISPGMEDVYTLVHELAHHITWCRTGMGGHGPEWIEADLEAAGVILGWKCAGMLAEAFGWQDGGWAQRAAAAGHGEDGIWGELRLRRVREMLADY